MVNDISKKNLGVITKDILLILLPDFLILYLELLIPILLLIKKSCARRKQLKVLDHLWKPGGTFYNKSINQLSIVLR